MTFVFISSPVALSSDRLIGWIGVGGTCQLEYSLSTVRALTSLCGNRSATSRTSTCGSNGGGFDCALILRHENIDDQRRKSAEYQVAQNPSDKPSGHYPGGKIQNTKYPATAETNHVYHFGFLLIRHLIFLSPYVIAQRIVRRLMFSH